MDGLVQVHSFGERGRWGVAFTGDSAEPLKRVPINEVREVASLVSCGGTGSEITPGLARLLPRPCLAQVCDFLQAGELRSAALVCKEFRSACCTSNRRRTVPILPSAAKVRAVFSDVNAQVPFSFEDSYKDVKFIGPSVSVHYDASRAVRMVTERDSHGQTLLTLPLPISLSELVESQYRDSSTEDTNDDNESLVRAIISVDRRSLALVYGDFEWEETGGFQVEVFQRPDPDVPWESRGIGFFGALEDGMFDCAECGIKLAFSPCSSILAIFLLRNQYESLVMLSCPRTLSCLWGQESQQGSGFLDMDRFAMTGQVCLIGPDSDCWRCPNEDDEDDEEDMQWLRCLARGKFPSPLSATIAIGEADLSGSSKFWECNWKSDDGTVF